MHPDNTKMWQERVKEREQARQRGVTCPSRSRAWFSSLHSPDSDSRDLWRGKRRPMFLPPDPLFAHNAAHHVRWKSWRPCIQWQWVRQSTRGTFFSAHCVQVHAVDSWELLLSLYDFDSWKSRKWSTKQRAAARRDKIFILYFSLVVYCCWLLLCPWESAVCCCCLWWVREKKNRFLPLQECIFLHLQ